MGCTTKKRPQWCKITTCDKCPFYSKNQERVLQATVSFIEESNLVYTDTFNKYQIIDWIKSYEKK